MHSACLRECSSWSGMGYEDIVTHCPTVLQVLAKSLA